jgi:hypothetical protein
LRRELRNLLYQYTLAQTEYSTGPIDYFYWENVQNSLLIHGALERALVNCFRKMGVSPIFAEYIFPDRTNFQNASTAYKKTDGLAHLFSNRNQI